MTKRRQPDLSTWQRAFVGELRELARQRPSELRITRRPEADPETGDAILRLRLTARDITRVDGGLRLDDYEEFVVRAGASPLSPPVVEIEHGRWLGVPHVLQGRRLCIYLDPSREWDPGGGAAAVLNRLWDWLKDAAAARFDASTALYHAVGGVLHQTPGTPTVVVREGGPLRRQQTARLIRRSASRLDLTYARGGEGFSAPVLVLESDLPFGASTTLALLLRLIDDPYLDAANGRSPRVAPQAHAFVTALASSAVRNEMGTEQYFVLAVPHPADGPAHLLAGRLPASTSDLLRRLAHKHGVSASVDICSVDQSIRVEWCRVSDERKAVTTRRDDNRPTNGYIDRHVHVWGCGGLGSWIAEYIARAGAAQITVCDPGTVTGGLLVRQNYGEGDIGKNKAVALADRLSSIRDDLVVNVEPRAVPDDPSGWLNADLLVDTTVSLSIGAYIDSHASLSGRHALIAQAATDAKSGTLGIVNLCPSGSLLTTTEIDRRSGEATLTRGDLELYHGLWREPLSGEELTPTRGCSVPTFHGSAADLAAVAASVASLVGLHLASPEPPAGTHLLALPHANEGPRHIFLPATG